MSHLEQSLENYEYLLNEKINKILGVVTYEQGIELLKDGSTVWFVPDYMKVHERGDHCYVTMGAYSKVETFGIKFFPNESGLFSYSW